MTDPLVVLMVSITALFGMVTAGQVYSVKEPIWL